MPEPISDDALVLAGGIAKKTAKTAPATTGALVAKPFTHAALSGRVVVRLAEESLDGAVDAEMATLGFAAAGEGAVVGRTRKRALGFPAWALVHHPTKARFALEVMRDFRKASLRVKTKPGHAKDAFVAIAKKLERSVPAFMPSYWEEVGRVFLGEDATTYASQSFEKARAAEREYKLPVDEDLRAAAYLEFTTAGAVPAKSLAGYADDLAKAFGPREAEARFVELNVQRIKAGVPPWTGMAKELAKLAKAAKRGPEADEELLRAVLASPSLKKAPPDFWVAYGPALAKLARASAEVKHRALWLFPEPRGFDKFLPSWLSLLSDIGAAEAVLASGEAPRWASALTRFVTYSSEWGHREGPLPDAYFAFLRALGPAIAAAGEPVDLASYQRWGDDGAYSPDVLEAALELGLPLAPPKGEAPEIALADHFVKDPVRLAAHPVYGELLEVAVGGQFGDADFEARAKGKTGLVAARRGHLMRLMERLASAALPDLQAALETLTESTSGAVFVEFPEAAAALERIDVGRAFARTLRGGLLDELTWPDFEAALAELKGPKEEIELHGTRQHPILRAGRKVVVFEGKRRWKTLDLPTVAKDPRSLLFLDGDLLATYYDAKTHEHRAVWASHAKSPFPLAGRPRGVPDAVPLPGGGVTLGGAAVHAGDTAEKLVASPFATDGTTFWQTRQSWRERLKLTEYDPRTGKTGRASWPAFVREASEATDGLSLSSVELMALPGAAGSLLGEQDGFVGHFVRNDEKEETFHYAGLDGRSWTGKLNPDGVLDWPGAGARAIVVSGAWSSSEGDEIAIHATSDGAPPSGTFGGDAWPTAGFALVPRESWLHYLEVRDLASSLALRDVTDDAARAIVAGAMEDQEDEEDEEDDASIERALAAVKAHLPGVKNPILQRGIALVAKVAAERAAELEGARARGGVEGAEGVLDNALEAALPLLPTEGYADGACLTDMSAVAGAFFDGKRGKLTGSRILWERAIEHLAKLACFIATRPATSDEHRQTLRGLLAGLADSRLLGATVTRAELSVKTGSPFLTRPKGADVWLASEGEALLFARVVDEDEDEPAQKVFVLGLGAELPVPADATLTSRETVAVPDDAAFIRDLLVELDARGPAAHDPGAAALVVEATSLTPAEAKLLVAGLPQFNEYRTDFLGKELRAALDLKTTDATRAKEKLRELPDAQLFALAVGTSNVATPAGYWASAGDEGSVAHALIRTAKALFGESVVLREDLVMRVDKECRVEIGTRKALTLLLRADADPPPPMLTPRKGPVPWDDLGDCGDFFSAEVVASIAQLIPYLNLTLPVGDAYRQALPALYAAAMERLSRPDFLLPLGSRDEENAVKRAALLDQIGGKKVTLRVNGKEERVGRDNGLLLAVEGGYDDVAYAVRTASLRTRRAELAAQLGASDEDDRYGLEGARAAHWLFSKECEELVRRIAKSPVPEGAYEANPLLSAKATVAELREALGETEEAAALYLQMLALPNPTKKHILIFNGWKPGQYDAAAAALVKKKLLIEGKRERAGREVFLPGGWEKKRHGLSMETYKLATMDTISFDVPTVSVALHTLYARAFARWSSGDRPGFEDVTKRKK